jgi:hypothetical protein
VGRKGSVAGVKVCSLSFRIGPPMARHFTALSIYYMYSILSYTQNGNGHLARGTLLVAIASYSLISELDCNTPITEFCPVQ